MNDIERRLAALERTSQLDNSSITNGSLTVFDADRNQRVILGKLPNGDYGLLFIDSAGNAQELLPKISRFAAGTLSTTSLTYTTIAGQPATITADIGAHGDAEITVGALVAVTNVNDTAFVGLSVDGAPASTCLELSSTASIIAATTTLSFLASEVVGSLLSPGPHTFGLQFRGSTAGHTFNFAGVGLAVQPI